MKQSISNFIITFFAICIFFYSFSAYSKFLGFGPDKLSKTETIYCKISDQTTGPEIKTKCKEKKTLKNGDQIILCTAYEKNLSGQFTQLFMSKEYLTYKRASSNSSVLGLFSNSGRDSDALYEQKEIAKHFENFRSMLFERVRELHPQCGNTCENQLNQNPDFKDIASQISNDGQISKEEKGKLTSNENDSFKENIFKGFDSKKENLDILFFREIDPFSKKENRYQIEIEKVKSNEGDDFVVDLSHKTSSTSDDENSKPKLNQTSQIQLKFIGGKCFIWKNSQLKIDLSQCSLDNNECAGNPYWQAYLNYKDTKSDSSSLKGLAPVTNKSGTNQ